MSSHPITLKNPGAKEGVIARINGLVIDFFRMSDEEPLAVVTRPVWDDLTFPMTRVRQGATSKPDFDTTNMGLLFPQNDATEIGYLIKQMPHAMLLGSDLKPHIHYVQDGSADTVWKLDYRWYENGADPTGSFTTITAVTYAFTYTSGSILQIAIWPAIDGSGITSVSSMIEMKLYRDDNAVTGDVLAKEFDLHYQRDGFGSTAEYSK